MTIWLRIGIISAISVGALIGIALLIAMIKGVIRLIQWLIQRHSVSLSVNDKWLVNEFGRCNVIVFGKKGSGKDLLFAHVIALRGQPHYSNIQYNEDTTVIALTDISVGNNTWTDCLRGDITKTPPQFEEEQDIYISDGGIYLPSQYDNELNKRYQGMPIFYALSRHLYNSNIHVNVQALGRLWLKLREQADSYIRVLHTEQRRDGLLVTGITYDNYNAANAGLLPRNDPEFVAKNGEIVKRRWLIRYSELQYNTRYFRDIFLERQLTPLEEVLQHV